ncbi:Rrf2 family transcriptional regulator [Collinsella sp. zg1085]|uniref:RrF2 family transcriptional regulator n=1 Tax=Collinsella sp. zg1085 TaxID=2844380 RepID=UPI001C0D02F4|nr:Rrf2 family transcriptional regulator [Collinsella sp. zg1085]QWT18120.1 Rrf2 family transcriptional regulator [Collinsella sp. zg1085]
MLVTSKGRYALRLMVYLAAFGERDGTITLRTVSEREQISLKYLEQLVRPLMHAGLLVGRRGKGGGYILGRPAETITAGDILRAAEGDTSSVACEGLEGACLRADLCSTVKFWTGLDEAIGSYVDAVTLADLSHAPDFAINLDSIAHISKSS